MYYNYHYVIDWDKVETLEDMKNLFKAINIAFEPTSPALKDIMHLVKQELKTNQFNGYLTAAEEPPAESE